MKSGGRANLAKLPIYGLIGIEAVILYSGPYVASSLQAGSMIDRDLPSALSVVVVVIVVLLSFSSMGLYHFHQRSLFWETIGRIIVGLVVAVAFLFVSAKLLPAPEFSAATIAIGLLYVLAFVLMTRFFFHQFIDSSIFRRRCLIYGAGQSASAITGLRRRSDRRGFVIVGSIGAAGDSSLGRDQPVEERQKSLLQIAVELGADEIVVAMDDRRGNLPERELLDCKLRGIDVIELLAFFERETGKIRIDLVNSGWLIFSPGFRISRLRRIVKRASDIVCGVLILIATLSFLALISLAIKIEDGLRAPIIYKQHRSGYLGRLFHVYKFRSMNEDAETDGESRWASTDDDRVTNVGRLIRRCRLDELPQIFNVLIGQMSLVGPRPERPAFVERLAHSIPFYLERHSVKPGITGWAQVRYTYAASEKDAAEKLQFDLYYVKKQSLLLDLLIILQTLEVVLWSKGSR